MEDKRDINSSIETAETRVVEKQKRKYTGFITDEEFDAAKTGRYDIGAGDERFRTIVYNGPGARERRAEEPEPTLINKRRETEKKEAVSRPSSRIKVADRDKFSRLIVASALLLMLIIFELSFFVFGARAASMPAKTQSMEAEAAELEAANEALRTESEQYGDYEDKKELENSWQRLKDKLVEITGTDPASQDEATGS